MTMVPRLALLVGALICSTSLVEGAVRLRQFVKYGTFFEIGGFRQPVPGLDLEIPRPGSSTASIRINAHGYRSPDLIQPKPPGTVRLAFVGASTTFCAEVSSNERTWPHLVWQSLQDRFPDVRFDYVNAAIPGITTGTSRRNVSARVAPLQPDVIVLYEGFNDVSVEARDLAARQGLYRKPAESWLARYSLAWDLVVKNARILAAKQRARRAATHPPFEAGLLGEPFAAQLTALARASQRVAPVVAIATLSSRIRRDQSPEEQLVSSEAALYYMPFLTPADLLRSYERFNAIIRRVARETGVLLIENEEAIPGDGVHFHDTIHFTDAGSTAMARRVTAALVGAPAFYRLLDSRRTAPARSNRRR